MALIEVIYEDNGAEKVISNINQVTSSVAKLKKQLQSPLGGAVGGPDINAFSMNAKNAAKSFSHMGIEYERMSKKMKSPLGFGANMTAHDFSKTAKGITATGEAFEKTADKAKAAGQHMGFVTRLLAAMAIRKIVHDIVDLTDAWTTFENKIKTVVQGQLALKVVTTDLVAIANEVRMPVEAIGTAFSRTSRAVQSLGKSQMEVVKFTSALSKAIQVGGSTTAESTNAMIQLSQGLASGALRGDELRSVLEQLPVVAQLIADKMGVTVGMLRKLGSEGKLTTDVVFAAITEGGSKMDAAFKKMQPTIEQAFTVLKNKFLVAVGEASPVTRKLADGLMYLAQHFDITLKAVTAFLASISAIIAGRGVYYGVLAMMANPWIALAAAVVGATTALAAFGDQLKDTGSTLDATGFGTAIFKTIKSDLGDMVSLTEQFLGLFSKLPVKITFSFDKMYERLATIMDGLRSIAALPIAFAAKMFGDTETFKAMQDWSYKSRDALKEERRLARQRASEAEYEKRRMDKERSRLSQPGVAAPGAGSASSGKGHKEQKERGKTFGQLMEDAELDAMRASVNELDSIVFQKLEKAIDSLKPSILATLREADKQIAAARSEFNSKFPESKGWKASLGLESDEQKKARDAMNSRIASIKKQSEEYAKQYALLEEQYRIEVTRDFYAKERAEKEKESLQRMEEMVQKENERTKAIEARRRGRPVEEEDFMNRIAGELDPTAAVREKIEELNHFKEIVRDQPEFVTAADKKIRELRDSMTAVGQAGKIFGDDMNSIFGPGGSLSRGFADAIVNAKNLGSALRELLDTLGKQALSSLIQMPINAALGSIFNPTSALGAVSSSGINSATGSPGTINQALPFYDNPYGDAEFSSGGYTGDYARNQVAGVVHGQEYVMNADATRANRPLLEAMNNGTPMPGSGAGRVTIINNAPGVELTPRESGADLEIVVNKVLKEKLGPAVAAQFNNPNSQASKAVSSGYGLNRSRR